MSGLSGKRDRATIVGVGVAACVACCAGPILAFLAVLGIGTVAAGLLFGAIGLLAAAVVILGFLPRRRRTPDVCLPVEVPVEIDMLKTRSAR